MIDTLTLKSSTNLIALAENDTTLKRKTANEFSAPCPFCGGRDRFSVQAGKWLCRNCTQGKWRDVIEYIQRRESCDFKSACDFLGATHTLPARPRALAPEPIHAQPPAQWQDRARQVVDFCAANLWVVGETAREYLRSRGLNDDTIRFYKLGFLQGKPNDFATLASLRVPCGIVLPGEVGDSVWYVKVRRADGEPKYENIAGGKSALFGADTLTGKRVVIITEGEFDAMLLHQEAGDLVDVVTMGSCSAHPSDEMLDCLLPATEWLIAYDVDDAGEQGARWWAEHSPRARRAYLPKISENVKDITDYHLAGGDLREWVRFQIGDDESPAPAEPERFAWYRNDHNREYFDPLDNTSAFKWLTIDELREVDPRAAEMAELTRRIRDESREKVDNH